MLYPVELQAHNLSLGRSDFRHRYKLLQRSFLPVDDTSTQVTLLRSSHPLESSPIPHCCIEQLKVFDLDKGSQLRQGQ